MSTTKSFHSSNSSLFNPPSNMSQTNTNPIIYRTANIYKVPKSTQSSMQNLNLASAPAPSNNTNTLKKSGNSSSSFTSNSSSNNSTNVATHQKQSHNLIPTVPNTVHLQKLQQNSCKYNLSDREASPATINRRKSATAAMLNSLKCVAAELATNLSNSPIVKKSTRRNSSIFQSPLSRKSSIRKSTILSTKSALADNNNGHSSLNHTTTTTSTTTTPTRRKSKLFASNHLNFKSQHHSDLDSGFNSTSNSEIHFRNKATSFDQRNDVNYDFFSRGLIKITLQPNIESVNLSIKELTGLIDWGLSDLVNFEVSLIQARKSSLNQTTEQLVPIQILSTFPSSWIKLINEHHGLTTESKKINLNYTIPVPNNFNAMRLLISVFTTRKSNLKNNQIVDESCKMHIGGMSFGIKKLFKENKSRQGWYCLFEPQFALAKHYQPFSSKPKEESCKMNQSSISYKSNKSSKSNKSLNKSANSSYISSFNYRHNQLHHDLPSTLEELNEPITQNTPKHKFMKTAASKAAKILNASMSSTYSIGQPINPQNSISETNPNVTIRRSWIGFGLEINNYGMIVNISGVAKRAGLCIGHKVLSINQSSVTTEFASLIDISIVEYLNLKVDLNNSIHHGQSRSFSLSSRKPINLLPAKQGEFMSSESIVTYGKSNGHGHLMNLLVDEVLGSSLKSNRSKLDSITSQLSQKTISPEKDSKLTKIADSIEPNQIGLLGIDLDLIFHDSVKSIKILSKKRKFIYSSKLTLLNKNLLSEGIHQAIESQLNENSAVGSLGSSVVGIQQRSSLPQPPCVKNYIQSNKYSDKDHYWVILLTDMILITKHEEEINKYKVMQAPIKLNKIYEVHGCGNMFNIFMKDSKTSKLQSISFQASTVDLAEMWKKLINKHKSKNSLINLHDESNNSICTSNKTSQQNTITTTASDTDYCSDVYIGESGVETGNFSEDDSSIPNFITSAGGNSQITTASTVSASVRSTTILDNTSSISSSTKKSSLDSFQPVQYSKSITSTYSMGSHGSSVNNINMNSTTSKKQHTQSASIYLPQNFNASQKRKSLQLNNKSEENLSKNQKALIKSWIRRKSNKFIKDNTSSQSEDNYCKCHSLASTPVNSLPGHFSHSQDSDICHHCNKPSKSKFSNKPKTSYLTDKLQSSLSIDDDEVDSGNNTSNSTNIGETESTSQGVTITVLKDDSHFNHNNRNSNNYNNQNSNNSPSEDPTLSLDILLKNDKLRSNFKEFLESEFSDENLEFYEAIETLQKNFNEIDASSLEFYQQSKMIINTFIIANSPREINIDAATRNLLLEEMKNKTISVNTLGVAQSKIYNLMARDSFVRFLKSNFYKN